MAHQQRPARGRVGNQRAQHTRTPPPTPPFNWSHPAPSARVRGEYQPARGRSGNQPAQFTHTPPPPFSLPPAGSRRGNQRYVEDAVTGMGIGAAAAVMSGYGVPDNGGFQNLPNTTRVVATGTEVVARAFLENNGYGDYGYDGYGGSGGSDGYDGSDGYGGSGGSGYNYGSGGYDGSGGCDG